LMEKGLEEKGPSRGRGNAMSVKALIIGKRMPEVKKLWAE